MLEENIQKLISAVLVRAIDDLDSPGEEKVDAVQFIESKWGRTLLAGMGIVAIPLELENKLDRAKTEVLKIKSEKT